MTSDGDLVVIVVVVLVVDIVLSRPCVVGVKDTAGCCCGLSPEEDEGVDGKGGCVWWW